MLKNIKKEIKMEKFYFLRDKDRKPVVTVYLIKNNIGIGKGISICSKKDAINKRVGVSIARQRAVWALKSRLELDLPINRRKAIEVCISTNRGDKTSLGVMYKAKFNLILRI